MLQVNFQMIRNGLAALPRADNHAPGARVEPDTVFTVQSHRAALDPDRALVVGNRGMGKSFWAHALAQQDTRATAADNFGQQTLKSTTVVIGFNAAEATSDVAPPPGAISQALQDNRAPENIWRAVLARAANSVTQASVTRSLAEDTAWVEADVERYARCITDVDARLTRSNRRLLVVFDALDRVGSDWTKTRDLTKALLRQALACQSYRSIRFKLFLRLDQFSAANLFEFPDASKIRNTRVDLEWSTSDLYGLLFNRLGQSVSDGEFARLCEGIRSARQHRPFAEMDASGSQKAIVDALGGEFMGANKKRGFVFTWLPSHLADARGQTSPRTFLTAWREAALHGSPLAQQAVDHHGLLEGVRKASEDRLTELGEDYPWIRAVLEPLRGQMVPMEQSVLEALWSEKGTANNVRSDPSSAPIQLLQGNNGAEAALVQALQTIGVLELRSNGKINVPDIFRVEAGIKRKGGVQPPRRRSP